jgi:guanidinopropionase
MDEKREDEYIYAGIPTYMGGKFIEESQIKNYHVVFLGVPCDYGASYRLGAKYAPRQLREYSFWDRVYGEELYDLDHNKYLKTNDLKIADLGDVYVNPTAPSKNQDAITDKVYKISKSSFPLVCGGDHSITYGSFRGFYKAIKEKYPDYEVGIIHFDAHMDVEDKYLNMPNVWHGNVFRKLIEDGYLKGSNMYTIGPRGVVGREWFDYVKENKINLFTANNVKKQGILNIIKKIIYKNKNKKIKFYITFDIDCLDVSYVFGTGTPQCNGLTPYECDEALRKLHSLNISGFDIVELNPKVDDSHTSFVIAEEIIYHFLAFGLNKENLK